jgi:hypothetical protein
MKTTSSFALRCGTDFNEKHTCLRAVHEVQFGIQSLSLTPELFVFVSLPFFLSFFLSYTRIRSRDESRAQSYWKINFRIERVTDFKYNNEFPFESGIICARTGRLIRQTQSTLIHQ